MMRALAGLAFVLVLAGSAAAETRTIVEHFSAEFSVASGAGVVGAYPGGLSSPRGALVVPADAERTRFEVRWAPDSPAAQSLLFRACDGWCSPDGLIVGEVAGESPLTLDVNVPTSGNLTWEALVASGATLDSRLEGEARYFAHAAAIPGAAPSPSVGRDSASTFALASLTLGGLFALSWWLAGKRPLVALAAFYHRIARIEILDHPVRARVHAEIERRPGIHFGALRSSLKLGQGALDHHLGILARAGIVIEHRDERVRCFALPGALGPHLLALAARVRSDASRTLLRALAEQDAESIRAVAQRVGIPESTLDDHVARFVADGLIEKRREGGRTGLCLTPTGRRLAASVLV
jgi:DNA-binding MarR family transcriptional regulator